MLLTATTVLWVNASKLDKLSYSFQEEKHWSFLCIANFLMMTFKRVLFSEFKYFRIYYKLSRNSDTCVTKELLSHVFFSLKFNNKHRKEKQLENVISLSLIYIKGL